MDAIHAPYTVDTSPMAKPTSGSHDTRTGSGPDGDWKEAILASTATHHLASSVHPKRSHPTIQHPPSSSEDQSSDSSDSDPYPEAEDRWVKIQREATWEGDWKLADKITAFPVICKGRRSTSHPLWEPLPYGELKDLCKEAKKRGRSSSSFKNLLEATFSAHVLVPHNIKNIVHCLLTPLSARYETGAGKNI